MSEKHAELVKSLLNRTRRGGIEWLIQGEDKPYSKIGGIYVWLEPTRGRGGGAAEKVRLLDAQAETIDAFTDEDLENESLPYELSFDSYFALMVQLRKEAIRSARGADKAIDDLLKVLNSED